MDHKKHFSKVICLGFASVMILMIMASSVVAQEQACVFLKPGAGYAAEMRVTSAGWQTDWSGSFPIGSTKCQPLKNLAAGASYTVEVKAILGQTKPCTPHVPYNPTYTGNITYFASGTTLNVKCEQ